MTSCSDSQVFQAHPLRSAQLNHWLAQAGALIALFILFWGCLNQVPQAGGSLRGPGKALLQTPSSSQSAQHTGVHRVLHGGSQTLSEGKGTNPLSGLHSEPRVFCPWRDPQTYCLLRVIFELGSCDGFIQDPSLHTYWTPSDPPPWLQLAGPPALPALSPGWFISCPASLPHT